MTTALEALDPALDDVPGTISVWVAPAGATAPAFARNPDAPHYAASTMKAAILAALYRAGEAGTLDLDADVPVANDFASSLAGAPRFGIEQHDDQDDDVWDRVGGTASLRWLAHHMIVRSSNLATNVVLGHVGVPAVTEVLRLVGTRSMRVERGIEDADARRAGIDNIVNARDLGALMGAIATGAAGTSANPLASPAVCAAMLDVLFAQEHTEDLVAGLPAGTRIAHKNGWVTGVRHGAGVVFPDDAPPYTIVVATTTALADGGEDGDSDDEACALIARIAAASWADRHEIAATAS